MTEYSVVGKSLPPIDGVAKVSGEARYTGDLTLPRTLCGKILRSPYPHAKILHIDTVKAERLPGVKAVITGNDTVKVSYSNWRLFPELMDEYPLAVDKVRFVGDEVAAVAAIDEEVAEEALAAIRVEYEELPAVFTPEEAMKEGAPQIYDYERNINPKAVRRIEFGDVEQGFRESDYVREDEFLLQAVAHAPLEPHVCLANFESPGKLTVWSSTQVPYILQCLLAMTLGMREGDVRVIKPQVGGAFGGKAEMLSLEFCAALLSQKAGRPVKITYSREEEFSTTRRRHPISIKLKTGVKRDGTLLAKECKAILDAGAYSGFSPTAVILVGFFHLLPYRTPHYKYEGYPVYTNNPPSGAMRGFGGPQSFFAAESQMDIIAEELGLDPVEIRLRNARQSGDEIPGWAKISSCGFRECLERVTAITGWREKRGKLRAGCGMGIGCYGFMSGGVFNWFRIPYAFSNAVVKVNPDGTANLFTQAADIGQGSDTVLAQIAAEELGVRVEDVRLIASDTEVTPVDFGTWGSRVTLMAGNAVKMAAADAKCQLFQIAAEKLRTNVVQELEAKEGRIYIKGAPQRGVPLTEVVAAAQRARGGEAIIGRGSYTPRGKGMVSPAFSFGAQVVELEVDRETGQVRVDKVTTAHDCGKAINPMAVEGQLEGSIHMGLGYALSEELLLDKGVTLNPSFLDYKLFSAMDMPQMESIIVESFEPEGPFGAKEAGEGLVCPTAPAVANAIYNAIGVRIKQLPLTPERVIKALRART